MRKEIQAWPVRKCHGPRFFDACEALCPVSRSKLRARYLGQKRSLQLVNRNSVESASLSTALAPRATAVQHPRDDRRFCLSFRCSIIHVSNLLRLWLQLGYIDHARLQLGQYRFRFFGFWHSVHFIQHFRHVC